MTINVVGTSLTELINSIIAALAKRVGQDLENIHGRKIMKILSVISNTTLIRPIGLLERFIITDNLRIMGITILHSLLMMSRMRISKIEGSIFLLSYSTYLFFLP